jgi:hypothetical protein
MRNTYKGKFTPKNPHKYRGDVNNIVFRSSWEYKLMKFLDDYDDVLEYGSEEIIIPYISPLDGKMHRYFVDFYVKLRDSSGKIQTYIIEVKPWVQTQPPVQKKRVTAGYLKECQTFAVNQAKWKAAEKFAQINGIQFKVMTEKELFGRQ